MSVTEKYCNGSQKLSTQQLLFKGSLFMFHFVSALYYLDFYYIEYPVKQPAFLHLKLPLKLALLSMFLLFLER